MLTEVLIDAMLGWNVDSRLSAITVDNCSTNDSMIGKIKEKLSVDFLLNDGSLLHMHCTAHILNLIVRIGLDVIKHAIDNVRDIVVFWITSPKRIERFEDVCRQMKVPCTRRLGLDCPIRWNSTYLMLKTALAYKNVFPRLSCLSHTMCLCLVKQNGRLQRMFAIGWSCSIMSLSYFLEQDIPLPICFFL